MRYNYFFTEKAENDLDGIIKHISVNLANKSAAQNFFVKVFENVETICAYPETGLLINNEYVADKGVRRVLIDNYVMYYKTDADNKHIYIVRILYGKRNLTEIIKEL